MNLLIQLNFFNGLGNLYTAAVQIVEFATFYKKLGYNCKLVFASNTFLSRNGYGDKNNYNKDLTELYNNIHKKIKNTDKNFFLTSSCVSCLKRTTELPNVFISDYRKLNENLGDIESFWETNKNREERLNLLYENISEMVIISNYETVYHFTILSWKSTFLYYGFSNNNNLKIKNKLEI